MARVREMNKRNKARHKQVVLREKKQRAMKIEQRKQTDKARRSEAVCYVGCAVYVI